MENGYHFISLSLFKFNIFEKGERLSLLSSKGKL